MAIYKIIYNLQWTYEDKEQTGLEAEQDADDQYNAVAMLQYLIGGVAMVEIVSVEHLTE